VIERRAKILLEAGVGVDFGELLGIGSAAKSEIGFELVNGFGDTELIGTGGREERRRTGAGS